MRTKNRLQQGLQFLKETQLKESQHNLLLGCFILSDLFFILLHLYGFKDLSIMRIIMFLSKRLNSTCTKVDI
jgi:hypothetical protein